MTTREQVHKVLDELPESELEPVLEFIASRRESDIVDEWGNLSAMTRASTARAMRRLDEEEAATGFSWDQYRPFDVVRDIDGTPTQAEANRRSNSQLRHH